MHGLDPDVETPVHFLDPKRKLAATALLSRNSAPGGYDHGEARALRHSRDAAG